MFIAYAKDNGKEVKFTHKIDWLTAIKGNFTAHPPGKEPVKEVLPDKPKGETVVGIDEPINVEGAVSEKKEEVVQEQPKTKGKRIAR